MVADRIEHRPSGASAVGALTRDIVQELIEFLTTRFLFHKWAPVSVACYLYVYLCDNFSGKGLRVSICPGGAFPRSDDDDL